MRNPTPPPIQTPLQAARTAQASQRQNAIVVLLLLIAVLMAAGVGVGSIIAIRLFTAPSAYDEFKADMKQTGDTLMQEAAERHRRADWNQQVLDRLDQMSSEGKPVAEMQAYEQANWDKPPADFKGAK